ncbi:protocadherin-like wing polarity protein stan isoform X2 [Hyposmocoma kahamanoa]|uniref:protocadherin-like wing polarity protein stan isoform X2 n=1 Tax=Hyposmocoma kahamanoa TaxID=1477025 RepID=UPI000E6D602C|nr:protocadherin-like wing polarity protein stan isoform X2 [Hyposmocoma kahamanoa]
MAARLWARALLAVALLAAARAYLVLVPDTAPSGHPVLDAAVYKLGSERKYSIDVHRTANFVHHILRVNRTTGLVTLRKRLRCDGVFYPNLFTFYVDSTSDRIRDIEYYSLPIRVLVIGEDCNRRHADLYDIDFDRVYDQSDSALQYEDEDNIRDKREVHIESIDWRLLEADELVSSQYNVLSTAIPWSNVMFDDFSNNRNRTKRSHQLIPFDMSIDIKIAEAKQWVSETYASFAIPTTDKWQGICLKKSQFVNSLTAFLPRSVQKMCKVQFLDVSDPRFIIEASQGDLVASSDVCIQEPIWKISVLFTFNCDKSNIIDSDHRLKIVYHHQELNETDIARRVKRELRNQSPYFEQPLYVASVAEEQPPGVVVTTVRARDPENSPVTYSMSSLLDSRSAGMFAVDSRTGVITTQARLDRERLDVHYFRVVAQDDTFPPRSGTTTLQINVLDCNDHAPVFEMPQYEASVREGASPGTTVLTLKATDQDFGKNAEVEYSIESVTAEASVDDSNDSIDNEQPDTQEVFRVDGRSGALLTRSPLDREKVARYTVIVKATDQASPVSDRLSSTATVYVNILDDNDNYPQFSEKTYTVNIDEDITVADNPVIARIKATDADLDANAAIRYAIIGGNTQMQFSIDSLSGDVSLVKPLDYEQVRSYRLVIRAQDGGSPSRSNTTQLLVNVRDVNDNAPRFYTSLFQESVSENVAVGYSIVRVQAYDADEGVNAELTYTLTDKDYSNNELPITIDPRSGWVYTSGPLDREVQSKYQLQVTATDGGTPPRSATASVVLVIQDVNDNDPVFSPPQYEVELAEDEPPGTPVVTVTATDADEDNRLHYEITGGNIRGRFSITSQNGRGLITVAQPLDFKQERRYVLTITATDSGGRSDNAMVHINITDANNYAPVFENAPYTASVFEDAPIGTTVLVVSATDSDVGMNAQITYTLSSEISNEAVAHHEHEFSINPQTGAITTNKLLDRETMSGYLLTVTARDGGVPSLSDTTDVEISVVDVNDNEPVFKQQIYSSSIMEDALVGTSVIQVSATDADVGLNGRVHYELDQKDKEEGSFVIDSASGVIRTNKALDRESVATYDLKALAIDGGTPPQSSSVIVHIKVEDINDSPPVFASDCLTFYVPENSPIGTTIGEIYAHDPDEGANAVVHYSIKGGDDSNSFSLETRQGSDKAELVTMVDLDYESPRKKYELVIRAASPPLWNDVRVEILVTDVNDNAPMMKDFQIIFNNYKDCFPVGPFGRVPAYDADVTDKLQFRILSGNNANLVLLNETTGSMTLSPQLNTNVPKLATMEISVSDGVNEIKAMMQLSVRLITEEMLFNSITVRLNDMTAEQFLSPLLGFFIDGLAAIIPCPKENIYIFSIQDDTDVTGNILNVSFSARRPEAEIGVSGDTSQYYSPTHLRERVYLHRSTLARLATVQVLPFDDNICVHEPCLNYEECLTVLKFGNASGFITSDSVLFRPIYPVTTFACQCPQGFTGSREHYMCDTEVDLCYSSPCVNNGTCLRREGGYTCVCTAGFTGVNCETILTKETCDVNGAGTICRSGSQCVARREGGILCQGCTIDAAYTTALCELRARSFPVSSFLTFPSLKRRHRFHLKMKFATQTTSGLLLYNGRYNERHDFIALEVVSSGAGHNGGAGLRFTFGLGGAKTEVTVAGDVADGLWHSVDVEYFNRTATIILDECDKALSLAGAAEFGIRYACANFSRKVLPPRCDIPTETCHRFLDLTGPLQIGGLPNIPSSFQVKNKDFVGYFEGCIQDVRVGTAQSLLNRPTIKENVRDGCQSRADCMLSICPAYSNCVATWDATECVCETGRIGPHCLAACDLNPCGEYAKCIPEESSKGYRCQCDDRYLLTSNGCIEEGIEECPGGWWGVKACGPCDCDTIHGYHPYCERNTGLCHCKENHYKPAGSHDCLPCQCYAAGSLNSSCEVDSGQCYCRGGVIGRACDSCANVYAEVAPNTGCEVIYDGCPRSFSNGVWWPRTKFGVEAITDCPSGTSGKATRMCDESQVVPWQEPDMFNCTTSTFYQLSKQLLKIETGELSVNTFVGVRLAEDLTAACANTPKLYGADVMVANGILHELMNYELRQAGLNLTHSQDKDYVRNIIKSANTILNSQYQKEWKRIKDITGHGVDHLLQKFDKYIAILAESQHDTYTSPFEIVTSDMVIGVDIVTAESIYGFEPTQLNRYNTDTPSYTTERVVLPDTSSFIHSPIQPGYYSNGKKSKKPSSPTVSFPKYNNYVKNKNKFDKHTRVLLPLDLLGINNNNVQETLETNYESRAVFSYLQYSRNTSQLMPLRFDESVTRRWGVNITLGSPILQVALFVPEYVWMKESKETSEDNSLENVMEDIEGITYANKGHHQPKQNHINNNLQKPWAADEDHHEHHGPVVIQPAFKKQEKVYTNIQENDSTFTDKLENDEGPKVMALIMELEKKDSINSTKQTGKKKLVYKTMSGVRLKKPVRLQMWLDINKETFGSRTNPQCVHWSSLRGTGEWSRVGCHTEIDYDWSPYSNEPLLINCTCNHLSTFAVLVDEVDIEFIPEPSLLESVTSYTAFSLSLPLLLMTWTALSLMRGGAATVSNSIHKHLIFCVFMAELLYLIALKARSSLVQNEFACKLIAMSLHYWWVAALGWSACDAWQLRRLVRELRDVNHGGLAAHLAAAYAAPAVALALAAGHHQQQYGNALFCWVSCHEPVVWWVVIPAAVYATAAFIFLAGATRAAFTVRDHVTGFGNLRMLLAVSIICLPLLCVAWASGLILGSESGDRRNMLSSVLAGAVTLHAAAASLGYIAFNIRVRDNLKRTILRCMGKKVPLADTSIIVSSSAQNLSQINRSSLAYHSSSEPGRQMRNIGISASSTTSRSTTKTSSSPYSRSDGQLRHTSTSTSNYNTSASDMPAYLRGFDSSLQTRKDDEGRRRPKRATTDREATGQTEEATEATDSDSDSARSLDLASSHSSDDDETSTRRSSHPPSANRDQGTSSAGGSYLPNITEGAPLVISPRWPAHIREEPNRDMSRWSQETGSDNEVLNSGMASPSPNPLPNPDLTSDVYQLSRHRLKPSILENVHDTYVASVDASRLPLDNRYGVMEDELMYGVLPSDTEKQMPYDPNYPISPTMYRLPTNPYGSKTYLSSRTSDYGYSPTKYLNSENVYGSRDFRDSVTTREHDGYPPRDFRDSGIATMLKNDYQRKIESQYGDYTDRMSEGSDKHHPHDKYLFPYTGKFVILFILLRCEKVFRLKLLFVLLPYVLPHVLFLVTFLKCLVYYTKTCSQP